MNKWFEKGMKKENFFILVLVGILLFVIVLPIKEPNQEGKQEQAIDVTENSEREVEDFVSYEERMEEKLEETLHYMEGAGKVKVILTWKASKEEVIEKDSMNERSSTTESDTQGGSRSVNDLKNEEVTVYSEEENGNQIPYVKKTLYPAIEGVVIICEGGANQFVQKSLTEAIQALFHLEAHKIKVIKMKSQ